MTISPEQLLVPIPDVCATLGKVSRTTVYDLVNRDELVKVSIEVVSFFVEFEVAVPHLRPA